MGVTNYGGLPDAYWRERAGQVEDLRAKINSRREPLQGRVIPGDDDLRIGTGKQIPMAVMFLDISSFSARRSTTLEEQDMNLRILTLFFAEMVKVAEDYGGVVEKNTGDGLMAYFQDSGYEGEVGSKRAIAAAMTMMATNHYLIRPVLQLTPTPEIEFRVSIDAGDVTIARLGSAKRFNENVAIGSVANFASKMLSKAAPGEIVIGSSARSRLPLAWQTEFTDLVTTETGWTYYGTGLPYSLYRYTGRWIRTV
jgi:adenylate cyclase